MVSRAPGARSSFDPTVWAAGRKPASEVKPEVWVCSHMPPAQAHGGPIGLVEHAPRADKILGPAVGDERAGAAGTRAQVLATTAPLS